MYPFQLKICKNQLLRPMPDTFFVLHLYLTLIWYIRINEFCLYFLICNNFVCFFIGCFKLFLMSWQTELNHYDKCIWAIHLGVHIAFNSMPTLQCFNTLVSYIIWSCSLNPLSTNPWLRFRVKTMCTMPDNSGYFSISIPEWR